MAITPGTRIGAYEVTSQIGEGGMGVVFRAHDTKLLRDVALKVLPDHFADDADRLYRFQREAQVLASLNHPNIAQIYGLEQSGGVGCIVMELVEGETLTERLKNGPIPLDEAIAIAKQIADALAAAHERGIVHRDLKPANIKLTTAGVVKVLDFGLAKALGVTNAGNTELSTMPTMASGSMAGMIVGTAGYMSPEQARGKQVDARTDIWAFGCVLYEMVTARRAFDGETTTDMIAKIVTGSPDLSLLPPDVPPSMRLLLEATLNKNVQQRLQHIGDARLFLDQRFVPLDAAATSPAATGRNARRETLLFASFAALLLLALIAIVFYYRSSPSPKPAAMDFEVSLPGVLGLVTVSPDGQRVAYVAQPNEENRAIWIRPIGAETPQKLAGTENASGGVVWSPDSRHLVFIADGKFKKVDVVGGSAQVLCDFVGQPRGISWNRDGVILFTRGSDNVIVRVTDSGGEVKPVTALDKNRREILHGGPAFLPDGKHFVYVAVSEVRENSGIFVGSLDGKSPIKRLTALPDSTNGLAYAPPGYLLLLVGAKLTAQRFDPSAFQLEGEPATLADGVQGSFSVSDTGLLFYRKGSSAPPVRQLTWFDRSGKAVGQVGPSGNYGGVELSPTGDRAAVDLTTNNNRDIWVIDIARGVPSRITFDPGTEWSTVWSPDAARLVFASTRGGGTFHK